VALHRRPSCIMHHGVRVGQPERTPLQPIFTSYIRLLHHVTGLTCPSFTETSMSNLDSHTAHTSRGRICHSTRASHKLFVMRCGGMIFPTGQIFELSRVTELITRSRFTVLPSAPTISRMESGVSAPPPRLYLYARFAHVHHWRACGFGVLRVCACVRACVPVHGEGARHFLPWPWLQRNGKK
jgi:hypothetical protein